MKRSNLAIFAILLLVFANGCSSSSSNNPTYPQVNYVTGGTEIYYSQTLDKNTGQPTPGSGDTITSVVVETGIAYQGMTGVTAIQNTHTNPVSVDTTYIAQSNGNYWHYNYGLELLNGNSAVLSFANGGKPINGGWVLQAEFSAASGTTWIGMDTTLTLTIVAAAPLTDTATETIDSSIAVGSSQVSVKHSMHSVYLNAGLVQASIPIDTYVSATDGSVLDIFHPTSLEGNPTPGKITILLSTK